MENDYGTESVHVINIDVVDNHEEATVGAFLICDLMNLVKFEIFLRILLHGTNKYSAFDFIIQLLFNHSILGNLLTTNYSGERVHEIFYTSESMRAISHS